MADDPDVPSLLDLDPSVLSSPPSHGHGHGHGHAHGQGQRHGGTNYSRMEYGAPSHSPGHGHSHGGSSGFPFGGSSGMPNMPNMDPAKMQQMQQMIANMTPQQKQQMMQSMQSLVGSGALPPSVLDPSFMSSLSGSGGHGHSHGAGQPSCNHNHGAPAASNPYSHSLSGSSITEVPDEAQSFDPLILAIKRGNLEEVKNLVEEGADVNMKDDEGNTTLHWAVFNPNSRNHRNIADYLIQCGVEPNQPNQTEGQTPLHWACIAGNVMGITLLLENDVDIQQTDKRGYNSLHHATQYNEILICYYLIQKGIPVDSQDNEGHTALHWAAYLGHENLIRLLLNCRANIKQQDNQGLTALHWAASKAQSKAVTVLLENHADPRIEDNNGSNVVETAKKKGYFGLAYSICKNSAFYSHYRTPAGRKAQQAIHMFTGFCFASLILYHMISFPLWFSFLSLSSCFLIGKMFLEDRWAADVKPHKFYMVMFVFGYWTCTLTYITNMMSWHWSNYPVESLIFYALNAVVTFLYCWLAQKDPGIVYPNSKNDMNAILKKMENGEKLPQLCTTCMMAKPLRAKHCKSCNHCVARFDHHCYWLDNCVGSETHKWFILMLALIYAGHIFWAKIVIYYICDLPGAPDTIWPLMTNLPLMYHATPLIFFTAMTHTAQLIWETMTLYSNYSGIKQNLTYNEMQNGNRYPYLKSPAGYNYNPFDKGSFTANLKDFLQPPVDYKTLYFVSREALL